MIRKFINNDIDKIMKIWLETNINAHDFIEESYWQGNYDMVKEMLLKSDLVLSVYKKNTRAVDFYLREGFFILDEKIDDDTNQIEFVMKWVI